jgi:hypothetical protein
MTARPDDRDIDARPVWDAAIAARLPGTRLLVGLTYFDENGELERQAQVCGRVESAESRTGIALVLEGTRAGQPCTLPPDTRSITPAAPGQYHLRSSGEVVDDPDFTVTFAVNRSRAS